MESCLQKNFDVRPKDSSAEKKLRIAVLVSKAAIQFLMGVSPSEYTVPEEVKAAGFQACVDDFGSIVEGHDVKKLKFCEN
ncbi:putative calcium-transporting ATPase 7, plasma membrane-type [Mangifera indica]|uniref:putative calcium-transporting ATPase 7, plasma membrane-type n=1 Tax=Mangifera indica TaxID=29780 RepID=UPI001CFA56CD|nr:putative calcium-transporting ATPase 7, plasma membrane-type [Mangifera indica]